MKKILFMLLSATILFSSCSSDDNVIKDGASNNNIAKYTVNLNVKSAGFEVDKTPLKSISQTNSYIQIIAYKESGEPYSSTVILGDSIRKSLNTDGSLPLSLVLPEGQYHIAFIHNLLSVSLGPSYSEVSERFVLQPKNFYTDKESAGGIKGSYTSFPAANTGNYYTTKDISVGTTSNNEDIPVKLEPMWSNVSVRIIDPSTFIIPQECKALWVDLVPAYTGYELATKLAFYNVHTQSSSNPNQNNGIVQIDALRSSTFYDFSFNVSKTGEESNNMKLIVKFLKYYSNVQDAILITKEIDLKTQVENGQNYTISGNLGNIAGIEDPNQSFNISLGEFNKEDVNIEF